MNKINNEEKEINYIDYQNTKEYKSDEYLFAAYEAPTNQKAKQLAKKALEIYPDNIDAQNFLIGFEKDDIKKLKLYDELVFKAKEILEKDNYFEKDYIGAFWGIIETRPYMRAKCEKMNTFYDLGRYREAIKECEEMLYLCPNDNLGIRYRLLGIYVLLEEFTKAQKLFNKYNENSTYMLFIMAIAYYKQGDYLKTRKVLKEVNELNNYIYEILIKDHKIIDGFDGYSRGSLEEASMIIRDLEPLIISNLSFTDYVKKVLK